MPDSTGPPRVRRARRGSRLAHAAARVAVLLALLPAVSCVQPVPPSTGAFDASLPWEDGEGDSNARRLHHTLSAESALFRGAPQDRRRRPHGATSARSPGLCVALSGGGMRSAAFSIGVLGGLHEAGVLREVDLASAISGGGYALSWYMVQHADRQAAEAGYDPAALDRELFDPAGAYQANLRDHFDLFRVGLRPRSGKADDFWVMTRQVARSSLYGVVVLTATALGLPFNLFANTLFGWHFNTVPIRPLYENSIERAFHSSPDRSNLIWAPWFSTSGRRESVSFDDLAALLESVEERGHHLPYPVFGVNIDLDVTTDANAVARANRLFEFTPLRVGADSVGWSEDVGWLEEHEVDVAKAVAISGAAVDSQALLVGAPEILASAANIDLGYFTPNPLTQGPAAVDPVNGFYFLSPLPFYLMYPSGRWNKHLRGVSLHLTDGGHTENLGVFPAARRLCDHLVVVDGTRDPEFQFDGYRIVRDALSSELGMRLGVPEIDDWLATRAAIETLAGEKVVYLRGVEDEDGWQPPSWEGPEPDRANAVRIALEHLEPRLESKLRGCLADPTWASTSEKLAEALECQLERFASASEPLEIEAAVGWLAPPHFFDGSRPVASGAIEIPGGAPAARPRTHVTYVKLSLYRPRCYDRGLERVPSVDHLPRYPDATTCAFARKSTTFPHVSTAEVSYGPLQYEATRDLGRSIACWAAEDPATAPALARYGGSACAQGGS